MHGPMGKYTFMALLFILSGTGFMMAGMKLYENVMFRFSRCSAPISNWNQKRAAWSATLMTTATTTRVDSSLGCRIICGLLSAAMPLTGSAR